MNVATKTAVEQLEKQSRKSYREKKKEEKNIERVKFRNQSFMTDFLKAI